MRSRKLQYLHVNDFTSDFTTIPAQGPRLRLLNLGRPPADIRICAAEFQNLFRFEPSIAARIAESCIFTFCDNLSSTRLAHLYCPALPQGSPGLIWPSEAMAKSDKLTIPDWLPIPGLSLTAKLPNGSFVI